MPGAQDARCIAIRWDYTAVTVRTAGAEPRGRCEREIKRANPESKEREPEEKHTTRRTRRSKETSMRPMINNRRMGMSNAEESTA